MMTEKSGKTTRRSPSTPTPAREDARRAPSSVTGAVLLAGALLGGMTSCRVPAPTVQQGLQYGFNTP
ncbi:MAG: hypothetical protein ACJAZN_003190, partial [Planctomycetota bacterium]